MLLSAVSVLVVAQSSSEIPEGLMNNPVDLKEKKMDWRSIDSYGSRQRQVADSCEHGEVSSGPEGSS